MAISWNETLEEKLSFVKVAHITELRDEVQTNRDHLSEAKGHASYIHTEASAVNPWVIEHNLNAYPEAKTIDNTDGIVVGDVVYTSSNIITITFDKARAGVAYLN